MLRKCFSIFSGLVFASSLGVVCSQVSSAATPGPFSCDQSNPQEPKTVAYGTPIINWNSHEFDESGYTPLQRCLEVSDKFNSFRENGQLDYITAGIVNDLPVVCAAAPGDSCNGKNQLFTLSSKNRENLAEVLQTLFDSRYGVKDSVVNESEPRLYIDVNKMLSSLHSSPVQKGQHTPHTW